MSVTASEWALLRALACHKVMLVQRCGGRAKAAALLKQRLFISTSRHDENHATIRITDAGWLAARDIEKELKVERSRDT